MIYKLFESNIMTRLMLIENKGCADNTHYFLRVISTMTQTEKRRRNQLQSAEPFIRPVWIGCAGKY